MEEYENCFWQNTEINQCIWEEAAPATSLHCAQLYSLSSLIQRRVIQALDLSSFVNIITCCSSLTALLDFKNIFSCFVLSFFLALRWYSRPWLLISWLPCYQHWYLKKKISRKKQNILSICSRLHPCTLILITLIQYFCKLQFSFYTTLNEGCPEKMKDDLCWSGRGRWYTESPGLILLMSCWYWWYT